MRIVVLAAAAALSTGFAAAAQAAPASVDVAIAPELQAKAEQTYGVRDINDLADQLRRNVDRELARTGAYDGARIELVLADAVPNHPTFKQLGDRPGLSPLSLGVGGARIEGRIVAPDGRAFPVAYRYYETDIRYAYGRGIWSDAETAISQFSRRMGRGQAIASR